MQCRHAPTAMPATPEALRGSQGKSYVAAAAGPGAVFIKATCASVATLNNIGRCLSPAYTYITGIHTCNYCGCPGTLLGPHPKSFAQHVGMKIQSTLHTLPQNCCPALRLFVYYMIVPAAILQEPRYCKGNRPIICSAARSQQSVRL